MSWEQNQGGWELVVIDGPTAGRRLPVHGQLTIGRAADMTVSLPQDGYLSGRHIRIEPVSSGLLMIDLGSTNGSYLNGSRFADVTALAGDQLRVGSVTFVVEGPIHRQQGRPLVPAPSQSQPVQPEPAWSPAQQPSQPASPFFHPPEPALQASQPPQNAAAPPSTPPRSRLETVAETPWQEFATSQPAPPETPVAPASPWPVEPGPPPAVPSETPAANPERSPWELIAPSLSQASQPPSQRQPTVDERRSGPESVRAPWEIPAPGAPTSSPWSVPAADASAPQSPWFSAPSEPPPVQPPSSWASVPPQSGRPGEAAPMPQAPWATAAPAEPQPASPTPESHWPFASASPSSPEQSHAGPESAWAPPASDPWAAPSPKAEPEPESAAPFSWLSKPEEAPRSWFTPAPESREPVPAPAAAPPPYDPWAQHTQSEPALDPPAVSFDEKPATFEPISSASQEAAPEPLPEPTASAEPVRTPWSDSPWARFGSKPAAPRSEPSVSQPDVPLDEAEATAAVTLTESEGAAPVVIGTHAGEPPANAPAPIEPPYASEPEAPSFESLLEAENSHQPAVEPASPPDFAPPPPPEPAQPSSSEPASQPVQAEAPAPAPVLTVGSPTAESALSILSALRTPLFALVDAAADPGIPELLQRAGLQVPTQSLFDGERAVSLARWAPYLLDLRAANPGSSAVLAELVRRGWGRGWASYFISQAGFADLRSQLRASLTVRVAGGAEAYFRFYDPRVLRDYLPTAQPLESAAFFGPVEAWLLEGQDGERLFKLSVTPEGSLVSRFAPLAV